MEKKGTTFKVKLSEPNAKVIYIFPNTRKASQKQHKRQCSQLWDSLCVQMKNIHIAFKLLLHEFYKTSFVTTVIYNQQNITLLFSLIIECVLTNYRGL